jgi:hypothetical protein
MQVSEYYGVFAAGRLLRCAAPYIKRRIGEPDATLRYGPSESGLWRVERVRAYQLYRDVIPASKDRPTLYGTNEAAWLVGVARTTFLRIAPEPKAAAVSLESDREYSLWLEPALHALRARIARNEIKVGIAA